jgi:hypothetical protein
MSLGFLAFLVVAYFAYDVLGSKSNPCGQLFEQTTTRLTTTLNILEKDTSLVLGRNRIQELSSSAQQMALSLQSCCIAAQTDKISGEQFLQCQTGTTTYANRLDAIAARLAALEEIKKTEPTILAKVDSNDSTSYRKMAPQFPLSPNTLQPRDLPTTSMRSATPSSEKAQIDSLVDEVLTLSVDFQKKVTGAIK